MFERRSAASLCLAVFLAGGLLACAPAPSLYSRLSVAQELAAEDIAEIDLILLEDDSRIAIVNGETARFEGESLVVSQGDSQRSFDISSIEALRLKRGDVDEWIDVLSPDDLDRFDRLPPVNQIVLMDGTEILLGGGDDLAARWATSRLAIELHREGQDDVEREIPLDEIDAVTLVSRDGALISTLKSPKLWLATAATAGLILIIGAAQDEEGLATR